jgi:hypothetical protein
VTPVRYLKYVASATKRVVIPLLSRAGSRLSDRYDLATDADTLPDGSYLSEKAQIESKVMSGMTGAM